LITLDIRNLEAAQLTDAQPGLAWAVPSDARRRVWGSMRQQARAIKRWPWRSGALWMNCHSEERQPDDHSFVRGRNASGVGWLMAVGVGEGSRAVALKSAMQMPCGGSPQDAPT
jgi:hypothetical protein